MPRLKLRAKRSTPELEPVPTPTRCCVVCYNDFTPFSFDSEKWSSNMIKNFYIALNIPWSGSEDEDGEDEEVIYLPFCPQCHTKVSVMQSYQIELQNLQSKFNAVRNDVAFAVVQSIGKHTKDGPIVQIRQQIFEKWKLTFEEKHKTESIGDEVGLEYIAHEPSSRPHICGVHFCNCQRSQTSASADKKAKQEVVEDTLQDRPSNIGNGSFFGNGNRKTQPQQARTISSLNGSMPVLSKMVRSSTGNVTKSQPGAQRHSTSTAHVPSLIPFQGSFTPREKKTFEYKVPPLRKISSPASNLNLSTTGGNKVFGRQRLQPPLLTYVGHKSSVQRAGSLKFPGSLSKFPAHGSGQMLGAGVKATVPSHIVAKTPTRVVRRAGGVRAGTGSPTARQRLLMQGTASRSTFRSRASAGMKEAPVSMVIEPEIGSLEALPKYGKRSISTEDLNFIEPPAKLARSGSISPSKRGTGRSRPSNSNLELESLDTNEDEPISRTRGSPRTPFKYPTEPLSSFSQAASGVFECQWCDKFYNTLSRLRRHSSFVHPDMLKIQCGYGNCTKGFNDEISYKRHVQHQHKISLDGLKTMTCPRCKKCFVKASSFRTHLKSHGMTLSEIVVALDAAENEEVELDHEPIDNTVTTCEETNANAEEIEVVVAEEKAEAQEPRLKVKRKQTIHRPFGIRKRKRRARNSLPKVEVSSPPSRRRRRSQKPQGPLDPVRKSSRQRGFQIDAGLPMYPAPKSRSRNKGVAETATQDESDGISTKVDENQESNNEKIEELNDPPIPELNNTKMKEPVGIDTQEACSTAQSEDSTAVISLHKDVEQVIQPSEPQEPPSSDELNLDDSFVRGAKSETTISTSPIRMDMNSETVFTSTPMACKLDSEKLALDAPVDTDAPLGQEGSTLLAKDDLEEPNPDDSDKSSTAMNTTYTLDTIEDDTGDGDSEKKEITQLVEDKQ